MTDSAPPLLMDAMLGKLARWLRLMGYDAAYIPDTPDREVVAKARAESRLILTRDHGLTERRGAWTHFIDSQVIEEQVAQVQTEIGPPPEPLVRRCSECNTPLEDLPHAAAQERVPPYVWRTQEKFTHCPECRRVYWPGTHWGGIQGREK